MYVLGYGWHLYGRRRERTQPSGMLLICTDCETADPFLPSLYPFSAYVPSHFCSKRHRICKQHLPLVHIHLLHTSCHWALKSLAHQTSVKYSQILFIKLTRILKSSTVIRTLLGLLRLGPCPQ